MIMFVWFWKILTRPLLVKQEPIIVGATYILDIDNNDNPFKKSAHKVVVKDFKNEWVSYRFKDSYMWQDESMRKKLFNSCYKLEG